MEQGCIWVFPSCLQVVLFWKSEFQFIEISVPFGIQLLWTECCKKYIYEEYVKLILPRISENWIWGSFKCKYSLNGILKWFHQIKKKQLKKIAVRRNEAATSKRYNEQSKFVEKSTEWHQCCKQIKTKSKGKSVYLFRLSAFLLRHARLSTLVQCILHVWVNGEYF